jgi:transposase
LRCGTTDEHHGLDGPIDGESFTIYVEKVLLPTFKPGDIVIMDNLEATRAKLCGHSSAQSAQALLPPKYSPDLNPIEQVFAKLGHLLRKQPRSRRAVWAAIGQALKVS